ncbi:MAG: hypothetical protein KatS3mg050_4989 [Litorilinea sp.]|nr:MAG: hypothetical protein KatS3mg050_4989 [Litorilinea sp.]
MFIVGKEGRFAPFHRPGAVGGLGQGDKDLLEAQHLGRAVLTDALEEKLAVPFLGGVEAGPVEPQAQAALHQHPAHLCHRLDSLKPGNNFVENVEPVPLPAGCSPVQQRLDDEQEFLRLEGFGEVAVGAGPIGFQAHLRFIQAGEEDGVQIRVLLFHLAQQFDAAHARSEPIVHEQNLEGRPGVGHDFQRCLGRRSRRHPVALPPQALRQQVGKNLIILNEEKMGHGIISSVFDN